MAPAEAETPADRGNNDKGACKKARKRIGVLALQGNFAQHVQLLEGLGMEPVLVRTAAQLLGQGEGREQLDGKLFFM